MPTRRAIGPAKWLLFALALCLLSERSHASSQTKLVWPLDGIAFEDWVIGNYVDVDTRPVARRDFRGGTYTYDGHDALDIGLAHFRAMDEGVNVLAAASGTVVSALDGANDRWAPSNPAPPGEVGNLIVIDHGDGRSTLYGHLKKGSVAVAVGETVMSGQVIGEVGSSGQSTGPHLHFTVRQDGTPIETFLSPEDWWEDPLPYTGDVAGVLDSGISSVWPTAKEVENGVVHQPLFFDSDGPRQLAVMWNYLYGIPAGSEVNLAFRRPSGQIYSNFQWTQEDDVGVGFWNHGIRLPASPDLGVWSAELLVDGQPISSRTFRMARAVPEPATCVLACMLGLAGLMRQRKKIARRSDWSAVACSEDDSMRAVGAHRCRRSLAVNLRRSAGVPARARAASRPARGLPIDDPPKYGEIEILLEQAEKCP